MSPPAFGERQEATAQLCAGPCVPVVASWPVHTASPAQCLCASRRAWPPRPEGLAPGHQLSEALRPHAFSRDLPLCPGPRGTRPVEKGRPGAFVSSFGGGGPYCCRWSPMSVS